ncbi:MAG TPA: carbon-nitrogen hydrolase family protein [Pseudomonas sp.]|uniref:carbon-nitrogen hydrolase family protein n=1 Tax=Pseudomonas sp. TaxID=306 RepID=UPI002ED7FF2A
MSVRIYAIAQIAVVAGDIKANVQKHLRFMHQAARHGAQFLLFPELSLTGYEPSLARALAINPSDDRLEPLRDLAIQSAMLTVVGAPVKGANAQDILIAALIFDGHRRVGCYTKRHLHPGEEAIFTAGDGGVLLSINHDQIALAVCADFNQPIHVQEAVQAGADVYAASVLISRNGYVADCEVLAGYAREHKMVVMMANHGGPTGGWQSAGASVIWGTDGEQIAVVEGEGDRLLIATCRDGNWAAYIEPLTDEWCRDD